MLRTCMGVLAAVPSPQPGSEEQPELEAGVGEVVLAKLK